MEVICEVRNRIGWVILNRPSALNTLTFDMLRAVRTQLDLWQADKSVLAVVLRGSGDKAMCAGGDVRTLREKYLADRELPEAFFAFEYALDYLTYHYSKPYIALMHGIVMGGGMGLSQGAKLRVATTTTRVAMPETTIGLFPDVGGSYFLSRTPGELGTYLGLTGQQLRAADVLYAGLADIHADLDAVTACLNEQDFQTGAEVLAALRSLATTPNDAATLPALRAAIDRHFVFNSATEIIASLRREEDENFAQWTQQTVATLAKRSPTMLCVTLEQLRRGKHLPLADCFRMELTMILHAIERGDFVEGVRALLVDKDNAPRWQRTGVAEVPAADVAVYFQPRWPEYSHPLKALC